MKIKLLLALLLFCTEAYSQTWINGGNGIQYYYDGNGFRHVRQTLTTPQPPFYVTDSLARKAANQSVWTRQGSAVDNAQEASVIIEGNPQILTGSATVFKMWYTIGFGSTPTIGYAESVDGISFTPYSGDLGISGAHSKIIKNGANYYMYVTTALGTKIARYSSVNGTSWTLNNASVIPLGAAGQWDSTNFGNTDVFVEGGTWHMIYEAKGDEFALGGATSTDGLTWTKTGQILTNLYLGGSNIHKIGGTYYMWCHTTKLPSLVKRFRSSDLLTWVQDPPNPTFTRVTKDEGVGMPFAQVCDVELVEYNGKIYQYYTANPDGSATYSGGVKIKVAITNMPFIQLITTTEDNPAMDIFGAIFVKGINVAIAKSPAESPLDIKTFGAGFNSGIKLESSGSTNTVAGLGQSEKGSGFLGLVTNNVGESIHLDAKPLAHSYVNNGGNFSIGYNFDPGYRFAVNGGAHLEGNLDLRGNQSNTVGGGVFFQLSNNLTGSNLRQQLFQMGADGDLINFSYNGASYRENFRISNASGNIASSIPPTSQYHLVNKAYVDDKLSSGTLSFPAQTAIPGQVIGTANSFSGANPGDCFVIGLPLAAQVASGMFYQAVCETTGAVVVYAKNTSSANVILSAFTINIRKIN
jgi:hypothetical protein